MADDIRIRVGVQVDASAAAVMAPIEQAVKRARKTIEGETKAAMTAAEREAKRSADAQAKQWAKLQKDLEREANKILKTEQRTSREGAKAAERAERDKTASAKRETAERIRDGQRAAREQTRIAREQGREQARIAQEAARAAAKAKRDAEKALPFWSRPLTGGGGYGGAIGIGRRAGIRVGRGAALAYGMGGSAISGAIGLGSDVLSGMGVDTSVSSLVGKSQEQQSLATKISNSAYVPGSELVKPSAIVQEARAVGNETGTDATEALKALQDFVGKTGDLDTARKTLGDMAKLSRATGTNLGDMADAAAEVTNSLGDMPDKAKVTSEIMKMIAGQGKLGAVEIRDLATQMAKLGAASNRFKGGAAANIATMGILAQEAKLRGGAPSASEAATAVTAFAGDFSQHANLKAWKARGLTPFSDESHSILSDPKNLIKGALKSASKNGTGLAAQDVMHDLFKSKQGYKAVAGFTDIYNQAGGGSKGMQAVDDEFKRLSDAQLANEEVNRAFAASMKTSEAQVAVFNNHMAEAAEQLAGGLMPAFQGLAPKVVAFSTSMANLIGNVTGANRDNAVGKADEVPPGTAAKDRQLLGDTAQVIHGPGGDTKVYSKEQLDVITHHATKQGQAAAELEGQVKVEQDQAGEARDSAGGVTGWAVDQGLAYLGAETNADKANRLEGQAAQDLGKVEELKHEFAKSADTLKQIYLEIQRGNAIAVRNQQAPPDASGGRAPGDADVEKQ